MKTYSINVFSEGGPLKLYTVKEYLHECNNKIAIQRNIGRQTKKPYEQHNCPFLPFVRLKKKTFLWKRGVEMGRKDWARPNQRGKRGLRPYEVVRTAGQFVFTVHTPQNAII